MHKHARLVGFKALTSLSRRIQCTVAGAGELTKLMGDMHKWHITDML